MAATAAFSRPPTRQEQQGQIWLAGLIDAARQENGNLDIRDQSGAVVATLIVYELPKRPKDMPRALRPKQKLSKRQRSAAKRAKLAATSTAGNSPV